LREDAVLAAFEDMSESDTSNSESESNSKREAKVKLMRKKFCDNFEIDSPENDAQRTKRRWTAGHSFQWQRGILFLKSMISQIKIQVYRPI
jgi:hypothetical protein